MYIHTYVRMFVLTWLCMYDIPIFFLGVNFPYIFNRMAYLHYIDPVEGEVAPSLATGDPPEPRLDEANKCFEENTC